MIKIERFKQKLSLLMALILVIGTITPMTFAQNELVTANFEAIAMDKIETAVQEAFKTDKMTEILVYMKDQVDTDMVALEARASASKGMTPAAMSLDVKTSVYNALVEAAEDTQVNLLSYLEKQMALGNVETFESYHIVNMVYVKATEEVVRNIAFMNEVEKINANKVYQMDMPIKTADVEPSTEGLEWNIERVNAHQAWDLGFDGTGVVVATLDSGSTWNHPALMHQWRGYDAATGQTNPEGNWFDPSHGTTLPTDSPSSPHGTHVMGTIVGQEQNGSNKIGVAPGAKWIAARVFNNSGSTTDAILLSAAQWVLAPGGDPANAPQVVNNSWGGGATMDDWYRDAVRNWRAAGIFPVFAAGNQRQGEPAPWPGSISNPANYPESYAVAALDRNNLRASFSKLGPSPYDETLIKPNVGAPGANIRSAVPTGYEGGWSGTSMAAPAVAGVAALMLSANSSLTVDEIEQILSETATPLTDSTYPNAPNFGYGHGLVDAFEAVSSVASGTGYITGRVLTPGYDMSEPVIIHDQTVEETFFGGAIEILADVMDDVAVSEVELLVKPEGKSYWILAPMSRIAGDHKAGTYRGSITPDMIVSDAVSYKIRVRDYAGDVVVSETYNIKIKFGVLPGAFTEGFEGAVDGWLTEGSWEFGRPSGADPEAFEGEKVAATKIGAQYGNSENSWLVTPPIDLRNASLENVSFNFHHRYNLENNYDFGYVLVTNDFGSTWTQVGPRYTGVINSWTEVNVDLSQYIGSQTPVFVAFRFTSDSSVTRQGWYIDGVELVEVVQEEPIEEEPIDEEPIDEEPIDEEPIDGDSIAVKQASVFTKPDFKLTEPVYSLNNNAHDKYELIEDKHMQNAPTAMGGIPLPDATVTVVETGRSVKVDPATGRFVMRHPSTEPGQTLTIKAEAYGHYPMVKNVTLAEDQTIREFFMLTPMPTGTISGRAFDRYYGNPAAFAEIRVLEDAKIPVAHANENGEFSLEGVLEGTYTLRITANGFEPGFAVVTVIGGEIASVEVPLKRFVGYADEIAYDDGVGENALVLNTVGYGLAVRFTPAQYGKVVGTNVYFWDTSWPTPGGNEIQMAIYDTDANGNPVLVGTTPTQTIVRGQFNYIDLSSIGFSTSRDFYISTIQVAAGTASPGTGIDSNSEHPDRSYMNLGGEFKLIAEEDVQGGLMIRAAMEYSVDVPVITNLEAVSYTNQDVIEVAGTVGADAKINVYVNDVMVTSTQATGGSFSAQVPVDATENFIKVTAELNGVETEPSQAVKVVKDFTAPVLVVDRPLEDARINVELVHVSGNVSDDIGVALLTINDVPTTLDAQGNFHERLIMNQGENVITVKAFDLAGNMTVVERTVIVELETPVISNIMPQENVELRAGETLAISFTAPAGGRGYYRVVLPFVTESNEGIRMTENNGVYSAVWTVPSDLVATNLQVELVYINAHGTRTAAFAPGKVTVLGNIENLVDNSILIGNEAFDLSLVNSNRDIQRKMTAHYNNGGIIVIKLNPTTMVTMDGQLVRVSELPSRVTYYDAQGNMTYYVK